MTRQMVVKASLLLMLGLVVPSFAGIIVASGAGPLPATAEDLTGSFPTEITGTLDFPLGVSFFKLDILNTVAFSAFTRQVAFGVPDTELFLFDSTGRGVYGNDDATGSNTLSCLPSGDVSNPCSSSRNGVGPTAGGIYYLAITRSANDPQSISGNIFSPVSSTDVTGPDLTMGGNDPVTGFDGNVFTSTDFDLVNYDIVLSGTTPEPATWLLMVSAILAFALLRRKMLPRQSR